MLVLQAKQFLSGAVYQPDSPSAGQQVSQGLVWDLDRSASVCAPVSNTRPQTPDQADQTRLGLGGMDALASGVGREHHIYDGVSLTWVYGRYSRWTLCSGCMHCAECARPHTLGQMTNQHVEMLLTAFEIGLPY